MRAAFLASLALLGGCFVDPEPDPGCLDLYCSEYLECGDPGDRCVLEEDQGDGCEACLGDYSVCNHDTGEWEDTICDPPGADVEGVMTLHQTITDTVGDCGASPARDPLVLTVVPAGEQPKTLTAEAPTVVNQADFYEGFGDARIDVWLVDDWGDGATRAFEYSLGADIDGGVWGTATATHGDCTETIDITGSWGTP